MDCDPNWSGVSVLSQHWLTLSVKGPLRFPSFLPLRSNKRNCYNCHTLHAWVCTWWAWFYRWHWWFYPSVSTESGVPFRPPNPTLDDARDFHDALVPRVCDMSGSRAGFRALQGRTKLSIHFKPLRFQRTETGISDPFRFETIVLFRFRNDSDPQCENASVNKKAFQ